MEEPVGILDRLIGGFIVSVLTFGYLWLDYKLELVVFRFFTLYTWDLTLPLRFAFASASGVIFALFGSRVTSWVTEHFW